MSGDLNSQSALLMLGEIRGIVQGLRDGQAAQNAQIKAIDDRLRAVEQKAAVIGAASGGVMALGTAAIVEGIKYWLSRGGPGQ